MFGGGRAVWANFGCQKKSPVFLAVGVVDGRSVEWLLLRV